jgi:hypothetical protein
MVDYEGENSMDKGKKGERFISCYEDECGSIEDENYDFDFDFDFDEIDQCLTNELEDIDNEGYEKAYQDGCKDGYEKAKQEVLYYMKKNKFCIKCKRNCKLRDINKNKYFHKII